MVLEISCGLEEADAIADRYGFTGARWEQLQGWKPFQDAIAQQRAELERSGYTFRLKAAMKADTLAVHMFVQALSEATTFPQKLEALKFFAKVGELEPRENTQVQAGTGFSIVINLDSKQPERVEKVVVDAEPDKKFTIPAYFQAEEIATLDIPK
jgi:hypothetical protein